MTRCPSRFLSPSFSLFSSILNFFSSISFARPLSRCLRIAHNFAVLEPSLLFPSLVRSTCRFLPLPTSSFHLSCFLYHSFLPRIFLSQGPLYIVITIFILLLTPFFSTANPILFPPPLPPSLALPSEFIKVSGVFSRN